MASKRAESGSEKLPRMGRKTGFASVPKMDPQGVLRQNSIRQVAQVYILPAESQVMNLNLVLKKKNEIQLETLQGVFYLL